MSQRDEERWIGSETDQDQEKDEERREGSLIEGDKDQPFLTQIPDDDELNQDHASVSDSPVGFYLVDTDANRKPDQEPIEDEELDDYISVGTNIDAVMSEIEDYTTDEDTLEDFAERQETYSGSDELYQRLIEHHFNSPEVSGDDIDADWERADQVGEETVGGTVPTPDQDIVEELGEAVGVTYEDDEPLHTADKLDERDRNRWELDPASADDDEFEEDETDEDLEAYLDEMEDEEGRD